MKKTARGTTKRKKRLTTTTKRGIEFKRLDYPWSATDQDLVYWLLRIETVLIPKYSTPPDPKAPLHNRHGRTDVLGWVTQLATELHGAYPAGAKADQVDGNMREAALLGMVLSAWYIRTQRAKTQDPRRPVEMRKNAHHRWRRYCGELVAVMFDDQLDARMFPGQHWDNPFGTHALDGVFT
jgi:hypothetical protein